jgi:hypothetical protein
MAYTSEPVKVTKVDDKVHSYEKHEHPAFAMIGISITQSSNAETLFGSGLKHSQMVRLRIARARMDRHLNRDWYHTDGGAIIEVELTHTQFAELITTPNRGDGVPCTLKYAPPKGAGFEALPAIENLESKADLMRREIKESAAEQMDKITKAAAKVQAIIDAPTFSKKALKEAQFTLKCHIDNMPSNLAFTVSQSEDALEKAISSAKSEVESYIDKAIYRMGEKAAAEMGMLSGSEATKGFLTTDAKE